MSQLHYHPLTKTFFNLSHCQWCNGPTSAMAEQDSQTASHGTWGDDVLPPLATETACENCKGIVFYVEPIKSKYAIIKRPNGEFVDERRSMKAANALCKELNDNLNGIEHPLVSTDLTNAEDESKMHNSVVVRLSSAINEIFPRGAHIELPIDKLLQFINENGVKPMAKLQDRKTAKDLIRSLIIAKKTDEQILADVEKKFPDSNADKKHCTKYRRECFVEELVGVEHAAVGSREHQEYGKANLAAAKRGPHKDFWIEFDKKQKAKAQTEKDASKAKADKVKADKVKADKAKADKVKADKAKAAKAKADKAAKLKADKAAKAGKTAKAGDDLI